MAGAVLLLAATARVSAQGAGAYEGAHVTAVRVIDHSGHDATPSRLSLPLQVGQPFHIEAEEESLRALYRTGLYAGITTIAVRNAAGVELDFVVQRNFYNNIVQIEGLKDDLLQGRVWAAMGLSLGEIFRDRAVEEGIVRVRATLQDAGYYQGVITPALQPNEETREMNVAVRVVPGRRARIGQIVFQNQSPYSEDELRKRSKLRTGQEVTNSRLDSARERLRKYLISKNYLGARVSLARGGYDEAKKTIPLTWTVEAGPRVRVTVEGARYSQGKLKKLVPVFQEGSVDEDLLMEGRRNLRGDLQKQGYFAAEVNYTTQVSPQKQEEDITYSVNRGSKHHLVEISFEGNHYLHTELLEGRLAIRKGSLFSAGRFSEQLLQQDADSIAALYQSNGFRDAKVTTEEDPHYKGKPSDLGVRFRITEGPQTLVSSLTLDGNHALSREKLLSVAGCTPGQPYSDASVASDRDNMLAYYFNEGFPQARFTSQAANANEPNRVNLTYHIEEGPQVRVGGVLIAGYEHTKPGVIRRQVAVKAGDPLRQSDVIETQQKLYDLGIFNRVTVAPQNPDGPDPDKDVVVDVEEAKRYTMAYGFGVEAQRLQGVTGNPTAEQFSASPLGILEISRNNVGGRGQTLGLQLRGSTLEYQGLASYLIPDFFARQRYSLQFTALVAKSQEVQTFVSQRYEGSVSVKNSLTPYTSLVYRYTFRQVLVEKNSLHIPPEEIPLLSQPTLISGFGFTWLRDHRDNPADAAHGSLNTVDVSQAARSLGSGAGFLRLYLQNATFYTLPHSLVFARSLRFGVEQTLPGTTNIEVPLPERFFAGGGTSLRGFGLNDAGPRDPMTGFPIGGLAELVFNQELRFPMRLPYAGSHIGGTVFYDAGNVYSSVSNITLRWTSKSDRNLEYFSQTVGAGLRYATPVGPLRVDFGYQLNPANFTVSNSITRFPEVHQLPHFQFFFSIGSVF
jgi:outer membrane protein assembly complex protein YaeT